MTVLSAKDRADRLARIVALNAEGATTRQIADALGLSPSAVMQFCTRHSPDLVPLLREKWCGNNRPGRADRLARAMECDPALTREAFAVMENMSVSSLYNWSLEEGVVLPPAAGHVVHRQRLPLTATRAYREARFARLAAYLAAPVQAGDPPRSAVDFATREGISKSRFYQQLRQFAPPQLRAACRAAFQQDSTGPEAPAPAARPSTLDASLLTAAQLADVQVLVTKGRLPLSAAIRQVTAPRKAVPLMISPTRAARIREEGRFV